MGGPDQTNMGPDQTKPQHNHNDDNGTTVTHDNDKDGVGEDRDIFRHGCKRGGESIGEWGDVWGVRGLKYVPGSSTSPENEAALPRKSEVNKSTTSRIID